MQRQLHIRPSRILTKIASTSLVDVDLLESHMPFYQSALGDRLEYEFTYSYSI